MFAILLMVITHHFTASVQHEITEWKPKYTPNDTSKLDITTTTFQIIYNILHTIYAAYLDYTLSHRHGFSPCHKP